MGSKEESGETDGGRTGSAVLADDGGLVGVEPDLALAAGHDRGSQALLELQTHHVCYSRGSDKRSGKEAV